MVENLDLNIIDGPYSPENIRKKFLAGDRTFIKRDIDWLYIIAKETKLGLSELLRLRYKDFNPIEDWLKIGNKKIPLSKDTSRGLYGYLACVKGRLGLERMFFSYFRNVETARKFAVRMKELIDSGKANFRVPQVTEQDEEKALREHEEWRASLNAPKTVEKKVKPIVVKDIYLDDTLGLTDNE
jgi:hypothetical protein